MIHYFNPGHETAVLNKSKYYMAPANVVSMQKELAFLSAWYACADDYVLIEEELPENFSSFIYSNFKSLPKAINRAYISNNRDIFLNRSVELWGISPQAIYLFENISNEFQLNLNIPEWKDEYISLSSRKTARNCLSFITEHTDRIAPDIIPHFYTDLDEIEKAVNTSPSQLLAKAPYSSSGRGLLWLPPSGLTRTERQIIHGHLKKQGSVSLEKVLDKKLDFAMEFSACSGVVKYEGLSLFETNGKGAYLGNFLGSQQTIEEEISKYTDLSLLAEIRTLLIEYLHQSVATVYNGYIGVDMMIYKDNNEYKLQPCLEINVRNNMGIVALNISQNILTEGVSGRFFIDFNPKEGFLFSEHNRMLTENPPIIENKRIKSGYLSLCPVTEKSRYRAYIIVND